MFSVLTFPDHVLFVLVFSQLNFMSSNLCKNKAYWQWRRDSLKSYPKILLFCSFQTIKLLNFFSRMLLRWVWMEEAGLIQVAVSLWVWQPAFLMVCSPALLVMCLKLLSSAFSLDLKKD